MKRCSRCGHDKSAEEFYVNRGRGDGLQAYCKACDRAYTKASREAHPGRSTQWVRAWRIAHKERYLANARLTAKARRAANPERANAERRRSSYRITPERFEALLEAQNHKCPVCGCQLSATPHVDHDHSCCPKKRSCGQCVRGLLCHHCNLMLGAARDNPDTLIAGARYLQGHPKLEE